MQTVNIEITFKFDHAVNPQDVLNEVAIVLIEADARQPLLRFSARSTTIEVVE